MVVSFVFLSRKCSPQGLTLIEVLVALVIITVALTAIIKVTTNNIRARIYLQNKTLALYAATHISNEITVGLLTFSMNQELSGEISLLNRHWYWHAKRSETPNPRIKKIIVSVAPAENAPSLFALESYQDDK